MFNLIQFFKSNPLNIRKLFKLGNFEFNEMGYVCMHQIMSLVARDCESQAVM